MNKLIQLPKNVTYIQLIKLFDKENVLFFNWNELILLFPDNAFVSIGAVSFLCSWGMIQKSNGRSIAFEGSESIKQYLSRLNLFRILKYDYRESYKRHKETGRFIPIKLILNDDDVSPAVDSICDLILHQFDNANAFLPAFEWAVNEVIDNIIIHSETKVPGVVCAQYYPKKQWLDVAVCDMGRGIRNSIKEAYEFKDHSSAVSKALERGVTRNTNAGQGNGLAGTHEISRLNKGYFNLWTGDVFYSRRLNRKSGDFETLNTEIPGTGISLRLKTTNAVNLQDTFIGENLWTYIEKESERIEDEGGLKIKDECVHTGGRNPAKALRLKIKNLLPEIEWILYLDFTGITFCSSSFLDELLGRLILDIGIEEFNNKIQLKNISDNLLDIANVVIHQRLGAN